MAMGEQEWRERAQSAEAKFNTLKQSVDPLKERIQQFKMNMGVRERSDGSIEIDFDKMVTNLGFEKCLELRTIIDETYSISGEAGKKPRVKVKANQAEPVQ